MADSALYVFVSTDPDDKTIYSGQFSWDGESEIEFPEGQQPMLTEDALNAGYSFPPPPVNPIDEIMANLAAGLAANDAYLAGGAETPQIEALTRQVNGLLRIQLGQLDDSSDT